MDPTASNQLWQNLVVTAKVGWAPAYAATRDKATSDEVGPAGTIGPDGPDGVQGVRGTGWFTGTGAPTDVPGSVPGDLYLESVTGDVYVLN